MTETAPNPGALVPYLRASVGHGLRTVVRYHEDGYDRLYADGELAEEVRAALRAADDEPAGRAVRNTLGARRATVSCHEDTALVHVPEGEGRGTLVTADSDALPRLYDLLQAVHRLSDDDSGDRRTNE